MHIINALILMIFIFFGYLIKMKKMKKNFSFKEFFEFKVSQ